MYLEDIGNYKWNLDISTIFFSIVSLALFELAIFIPEQRILMSRTLGINSGACLGFLNTPKIVFAFSRVKTGSLRKKQFLLYKEGC